MANGALSALVPELQPAANWLYDLAQYYGLVPIVTSVRRGELKQLYLYLTQASQVCAPGHSAHELGLAFDLVVAKGKDSAEQRWLGAVWQYIGGAWSAKDPVHFTVGKVGCY